MFIHIVNLCEKKINEIQCEIYIVTLYITYQLKTGNKHLLVNYQYLTIFLAQILQHFYPNILDYDVNDNNLIPDLSISRN